MSHDPRLPDVIIPGVQKCGSSSMYRWLASHPDVCFPKRKEPNYFTDERVHRRGLSWYSALFEGAEPGQLVGEASTAYLYPKLAAKAASRIAALVPDVRLVVVLREPVARLRSHYRHEVRRAARAARPAPSAV